MRESSAPKRVLPLSKRDFAQRFIDAISRRTYPNTSLHVKQLAGIAGYSRDAFMAWFRGEARVPGDALDALVTYFDGTGDRAFLYEIFAKEREALDAERDALKVRLARLQWKIDHAPTAHSMPVLAPKAMPATSGDLARENGARLSVDHQAGRVAK